MATGNETSSSSPVDKRRSIIAAAAIVVIVLSALALVRAWRGPRAVVETGPYEVVGRYLGEAVAGVLGEPARVVVLEANLPDNPASAKRREALITALEELAVEVVAREKAGGAVFSPLEGAPPLTLDDVAQAVEPYGDVDAVISLAGAPFTDPGGSRAGLPPIVVVQGGGHPRQIASLIREGIVSVAVVPLVQEDPGMLGLEPEALRAWLDENYLVVTADNLDQLP